MLAALKWMHPRALTRRQLATLAGLAPDSGTFSSYLSAIRQREYIVEGRGLSLTAKGLAVTEDVTSIDLSPAALLELWCARLKQGARLMLRALVDAYPRRFTREDVGAAAGIVHTSGTFASYLSALRSNGLIQEEDGGIAASSTFFMQKQGA